MKPMKRTDFPDTSPKQRS